MNPVFIDTSAIYAYLIHNDEDHAAALRIFEKLLSTSTPLLTHSFILIESTALLQRRVGLSAVKAMKESLQPLFEIEWIDTTLYESAFQTLLTANRRRLSLVDHLSFAVMKKHTIQTAFAFDDHFKQSGFTVLK